ncbi:MAG: hypothetical protein BCS36_06280 [Desulfovibrio sp. MES5]|uniref:hypothetical protein n=1 Tax=Desulfovibrio sp. MES5 TaxID=1899016 RepID=UPI000B9D4603|nr:hypothetical protein [Desulfovibrio sp. MES5]OXS29730.1 MAG: hypothetical protein BCS36_06280 [Desulfovibrio sp. MES5]
MRNIFICCLALSLLMGCVQKIPKDALNLPQESLANRQMQTRVFETTNNKAMLSAASNVMQDLGFTLEEAEYSLGVITGSKRRDATSGGQVAGAIFLAILTGVAQHVDKEQVIRVSMIMRSLEPSPAETSQAVKNAPSEPVTKTKANSKNTLKEATPPKVEEVGRSTVRVTFQRVIFNTAGHATLAEQINDPEVYRAFFDKLSQAVFLEAHQI